MRLRAALVVMLLGSASVSAQTLWNPVGLLFDHEPDARAGTTAYVLRVTLTDGTPVGEFTIPLLDTTWVAANTYHFGVPAMPGLATGATYFVALAASDGQRTTDFAMGGAFRLQPCIQGNALRPLTIALTSVHTWTRGAYVAVSFAFVTPHPIAVVTIDLLGDNQPAWYFPGGGLERRPSFIIGPVEQAGRYPIVVTAVDTAGCTGTLPTGEFINVIP